MKLTAGRMAHVKVGKGCVEALLIAAGQLGDSPAWEIVLLRERNQRTPEAIHQVRHAEDIHEPYGCMREIVILPAMWEAPPLNKSFAPHQWHCRCGWTSPGMTTYEQAAALGRKHVFQEHIERGETLI